MEADVLIPVYRPDGRAYRAAEPIWKCRDYPVIGVILMNTEEKTFSGRTD